MATLAELVVRIRADGAADTQRQIQAVGATVQQTASSATSLAMGFNASRMAAFALGFALRDMGAAAMDMSRALAALTGVGAAMRFQQLAVGFETLLGSERAAQDLLKALQEMGKQTPFRTEQLIEYSRRLLAVGFAANEVLPVLRAIADTAAAVGGDTETVARIALAISQIRSMPRLGGQEIIQLANAGVNIARLVSAATGRQMGMGEARAFLQSLSGEEAARILLQGMEREFGGAAQRLAGRTLIGVLQNIGETISMIMIPTGRLLIPVLQAVGGALLSLATIFQRINELTGGAAGLVAIGALLARGWLLLRTTMAGAIAEIRALSAALAQLAGSAAAARGGTAASAAGAAAGAAAGKWGILGILLGLVGQIVGNWLGGPAGEVLKSGLGGIGLGVTIGSLVPGIGTGVGAVVGALAGIAMGLWQALRGSADAGVRTAANTEQMKQQLEDIRGALIGGGGRARAAVTSLEVEMAVARLLARGIV